MVAHNTHEIYISKKDAVVCKWIAFQSIREKLDYGSNTKNVLHNKVFIRFLTHKLLLNVVAKQKVVAIPRVRKRNA